MNIKTLLLFLATASSVVLNIYLFLGTQSVASRLKSAAKPVQVAEEQSEVLNGEREKFDSEQKQGLGNEPLFTSCVVKETLRQESARLQGLVKANRPLKLRFQDENPNPALEVRLKAFWLRKFAEENGKHLDLLKCRGNYCRITGLAPLQESKLSEEPRFLADVKDMQPDSEGFTFALHETDTVDGMAFLSDLANEMQRSNRCTSSRSGPGAELILEVDANTSGPEWLKINGPDGFLTDPYVSCLVTMGKSLASSRTRPSTISSARFYALFKGIKS